MNEKVYIAGKITGCKNYKEKFTAYGAIETGLGNIVLNPAILPEGMNQNEYLHICFAMIDVADVVKFMPDWKDSSGAKEEMEYCKKIGKRTVEYVIDLS